MPSSIARLTALDHERLLRLLHRAVTEGPSQERWRDETVQLAAAHRAAERELLTPDVVGAAGPEAASRAKDLGPVDDELDRLVADLAAAAVPSAELVALGGRARQLIERHAHLAGDMLDRLAARVARKEIRRLGGEYEARRDARLVDLGGSEAPPRRLDLSRAELYELARRAGIEGRSAMNRAELIAQLQRHEGGP